jgi:hypothetical protein
MVSVTGSTSQILVVQAVNLCDVYSSITTRQGIIICIQTKTFSPATWMKKQTTQGFHGLDTPIRSSYAVHTDPHGQSVLADRCI